MNKIRCIYTSEFKKLDYINYRINFNQNKPSFDLDTEILHHQANDLIQTLSAIENKRIIPHSNYLDLDFIFSNCQDLLNGFVENLNLENLSLKDLTTLEHSYKGNRLNYTPIDSDCIADMEDLCLASKNNFPPCMRLALEKLQIEHKLKFWG